MMIGEAVHWRWWQVSKQSVTRESNAGEARRAANGDKTHGIALKVRRLFV